MKKVTAVLTAGIILAAIFLLSGCAPQGIHEDLVGHWFDPDNPANFIRLGEEGDGWRGEGFDWAASDSELRINLRIQRSGYVQNERWRWTLDGDMLRMESRQERGLVRYYLRDGAVGTPNPALVGTWTWNDDIRWEYELHANGTGTAAGEDITWGVLDGTLRIRYNNAPVPDRNWLWDFTISGDNLTLTNVHDNETFHYTRDGGLGYIEPALFGRWNWDANPEWRYIFNEDGTGNRGVGGGFVAGQGVVQANIERFYWGVTANDYLLLLLQPVTGLGEANRSDYRIEAIQRWIPFLDGDILTLQNPANLAEVYSYIRD